MADLRAKVLAGGAREKWFDETLAVLRRWNAEEREAIRAGRFSAAGGVLVYLVSGRKAG